MALLNGILGRLVEALLFPFQAMPPVVGLGVVSLFTAIGMLIVFRATSNQGALAAAKRQIHAGVFEIRLFSDDLRAIFRAQTEILRHNLTYLRLSFPPLLWMIVPLALLIAQLQFYYGYRGLEPGEAALLKVRLKEGAVAASTGDPAEPPVALEAPSGIRVETPAVWIPSLREVAWRIGAERPGEYDLTVTLADRRVTKSLLVSDRPGRRSPDRLEAGLLNQLLYPAEPPLPADAPVESITVTYPEAGVSVAGWEMHWMIVFFLLSILFAFALRRRFDVVI